MAVFFNGRALVTPAVESAIYDYGLANVSPGRAGNVVALIGTSEGGLPKEPMYFDSPITARRALRGGELLRGVEMAFNPSAESGAPSRVAAVRIEDAVQASLTLVDGSANDVITLLSRDYGAHTNGIHVTIEAGTVAGTLRLTVQQDDKYFTKNNVSRTPFTVRYGGAEASATVTVTASTLTLHAPSATNPVAFTLADYQSVRALCDAINAQVGFSAIAAIPSDPVEDSLDGMTATSCKSVDLAIKADLKAAIDWFNGGAGELVSATREADAIAKPAVMTVTYLSGGSNGPAPDTDDWQDGFDSLQGSDVQWVVPLTATETVWDMADAHVQFMSGPGKMERRAFVGGGVLTGPVATAISTAQDQAISLNSDRTALCFPSILDYDEYGVLTSYPAYFLAAKVAGGFAAMNFGNTMTNKTLSLHGIAPLVANVYDSDTCINSGILTARKTERGFIVSKAITTWLANDNYNRVEISTGVALDYVARTVRDALEIFVGRKASPITLYEAISTTDSVLRELARPEPVGIGVIVGDAANPAYRNISAEIQGDILRVWFECSPVIPINFVLIGVYSRAYSGSATAVVNA